VADVITTVNALPLAIKAGWLIWVAWAAAQALWYRRARVAGSVAQAPVAPAARRRPEARPDPRPELRSERRSVRQEAAAPSAPPEPASSLPAIDLSDIVAAAERSASADAGTSRAGGSILGLDSRP
jgi:hypothetical protein